MVYMQSKASDTDGMKVALSNKSVNEALKGYGRGTGEDPVSSRRVGEGSGTDGLWRKVWFVYRSAASKRLKGGVVVAYINSERK